MREGRKKLVGGRGKRDGERILRLRGIQASTRQLSGFLVPMQLGCHGNEGLEVKCLGNSITKVGGVGCLAKPSRVWD